MASSLPDLPIQARRLLHAWLCLAVAALVGAGLFAGLVAMSRTPWIQGFLPGGDYLRKALVGHVVLSVVVWFLAFQGGLWVLADDRVGAGFKPAPTAWIGFWTAALGTAVLMTAAFLGWGDPVLANYIPVLAHPVFTTGLALFGAGVGLAAVHTLWNVLKSRSPLTLIAFGSGITSAIVLISLLCFSLAALTLVGRDSSSLPIEEWVWGGGHVLQFANTAAMVLAWLMLARLSLDVQLLKDRWAKAMLALYLIFALPAPFLYLEASPRHDFTLLMALGLGPATAAFALVILWVLFSRWNALPWADPRFASFVLSVAVFSLGGVISLGIRGSNVIIPAHYHGVIGGVTLAFMGFSYHLLPMLGRKVWSPRLARWQPYLYGTGQTLFVLGLFWAGVHGVPRKTFGMAQGLHDLPQMVGMSLMGVGGLIAILGGIAFIVNMVPSLIRNPQPEISRWRVRDESRSRLPIPHEASH